MKKYLLLLCFLNEALILTYKVIFVSPYTMSCDVLHFNWLVQYVILFFSVSATPTTEIPTPGTKNVDSENFVCTNLC